MFPAAEDKLKIQKLGKTIKYTKASYQKMFADYISAYGGTYRDDKKASVAKN